MNALDTNNLSKEKIQQLLASLGSKPAEDTTQIEAVEYNWRQPRYFSGEQLKLLKDFIEKVAVAFAERLARFSHNTFNVIVSSTTEHCWSEFLISPQESKKNDYYLTFGSEHRNPCGFIDLSSQAANALSTQLLGDTESENSPRRNLSELEESLLLDTASALIEVFSPINRGCGKYAFQPAKSFVRGQLPLELQGTEELFKIIFAIKKADAADSFEICILILCSELERATGITTATGDESSAKKISQAIVEHIERIPVPVGVRLSSTSLSFGEIMNLQVNDVLVLDKKIDEPVELLAGSRTVCRGRPAKSEGEYAMIITEPLYTTSQNKAN